MFSKKKIFIHCYNMRLGGVERSLIGMLKAIDYSRYEVDLFLSMHDGSLMKFIPRDVNLLPEIKKYGSSIRSVKEILRLRHWDILWGKIRAKYKAGKYVLEHHLKDQNLVYENYLHFYTLNYLPEITNKEYDLAISFVTPHFIVQKKIRAKKKVAWIHTDYSFFDFDERAEESMWTPFDYIASISEQSAIAFAERFPSLKSKLVLIENILQPDFVRQQADEFSVENEMQKCVGEWILCSVGRFSHAKNFDSIPEICKRIIETGISIRWYLIGFGGEEALIKQKISDWGMQERVIILGKKDNPYPYMKACDIYVQPSRFEGKSVTVREAQILGKPVVITKFASSSSQLHDGKDGIIVPMDNEGCAKRIMSLIKDEQLRNRLIENCKQNDYGNESEVEKIYGLLQ